MHRLIWWLISFACFSFCDWLCTMPSVLRQDHQSGWKRSILCRGPRQRCLLWRFRRPFHHQISRATLLGWSCQLRFGVCQVKKILMSVLAYFPVGRGSGGYFWTKRAHRQCRLVNLEPPHKRYTWVYYLKNAKLWLTSCSISLPWLRGNMIRRGIY